MKHDSAYTFSLYVSGINLSEINPLETAKLLEALCGMLGAKNLEWGHIKQGSADLAVKCKPEFLEEKLKNFKKSISRQTGSINTISEFLDKHPQASTLLRYKNSSNDEYIELYQFQRKDQGFVFSQNESIRCRMIGLHEGTDKTDHIRVETVSGNKMSVGLSPALAVTLGSKFRTNHQLKITGTAKYKYRSYNDIELLNFMADSIVEIEDGNLSDWISEFKKAGDSGWNEFNDPIDAWLKERHE
ncbi:hypothetical protein ACT44T_14490 [Acinetobacter baumannii]